MFLHFLHCNLLRQQWCSNAASSPFPIEQKESGKKAGKTLSPTKTPTDQAKPTKKKAVSPGSKQSVKRGTKMSSPKKTATEQKKPSKKAVSPSKQTKSSSKKRKEKVCYSTMHFGKLAIPSFTLQ